MIVLNISKTIFVFAIVCFSGLASAYCIDNWACYEIREEGKKLSAWIENKQAYPFTATLTLYTRNLQSSANKQDSYTETRVVGAFEKLKVITLTPQTPKAPFSYREVFDWTPGSMYAVHNNNVRYRLPFQSDKRFPVVQGYGGGYSHQGASQYALDFAMPQGTPVHAARGGIVIDLTEHNTLGGASRRYARYANFVTILHSDQTTGEYYHLQKNGVTVSIGDQVNTGDLIGYSGNTGFSSLPHLHFAVYKALSHGNFESIPIVFEKNRH